MYSIDWLVFINETECLLRGTFYILRSAHTVYLCVLCGSENKQRLFQCTALTDWLVFINETESVYCAVRTESLNIIQVIVASKGFRYMVVVLGWLLCYRLKNRGSSHGGGGNSLYYCFHFLPEATRPPVQWVTLVSSRGVQKVVALLNH